jgi:mono/diheme cytochrome c family protein
VSPTRIPHSNSPLVVGGLALFWAMLGCQSAPTDLRPWQASDHTNVGESSGAALPRPGTNANSRVAAKQVDGKETNATPGLEEVTIAAWRANCVLCHGGMGRGDGPQAPMYTPRDLSDPAWQGTVSDEQLFTSIQKGKNKMPPFTLPDQVAHNLVALVRLLNRDRLDKPAAPPASASAVVSATSAAAPPAQAPSTPHAQVPANGAASGSPVKPSPASSTRGHE